MSPMPTLSRPLRRRLLERLERLHQALASLARRLREAVAALAGEHAGAAARDAIAAALGHDAPAPSAPEPSRYGRPSYHDPYPYDPQEATYRGEDPYREEDPNDFWGEPPPASDPPPPPPPAEAVKAPRRWPLLPAALEALGWWIRSRPARAPARTALGLGAVAALAAVVVGPLAGLLVVAAGAALVLPGMISQGH
jgi:hypothetical protein